MLGPRNWHAPARIVAVDIDGTLLEGGVINLRVMEWCKARKADGYEMILWSARGSAYAREIAAANALESTFDLIVGKPGLIVDDMGWTWAAHVPALHPNEIA